MQNDPTTLRRILNGASTIAVVGLSPKHDRPSHEVAAYLQKRGHRIVPINPGHAGQMILGETVYPDLASIPAEIDIDMVDIFRRSEAVPEIVEAALAALPGLKSIWMQLGVSHEEAAAKARKAGVEVVQNRCPKIEYPRVMDLT